MTKEVEATAVAPTRAELMAKMMAALTPEQKAAMYPPIERKNFVVRKAWYGRHQIITFVNNKAERMTYDHDAVLDSMRPRLEIQPCWEKRGYWSQSTNAPMTVRHLMKIG
jgi:hypothetical protein